MKKSNLWKSILALGLVFVAGGVAGSIVTDYVGRRALAQAFDFNSWPDGLVHVLEGKMQLTPNQKTRLHAIGEQLAGKMKATLDQAIADSGTAVVDAQRKIDQVLTPEQRKIHAEMKAEFRSHLKERLGIELPPE